MSKIFDHTIILATPIVALFIVLVPESRSLILPPYAMAVVAYAYLYRPKPRDPK